MRCELRLVKKILYILRNLGTNEVKMTDIEVIYKDNKIVGYRFEVKAIRETAKLKIIEGHKNSG